MRVICGYYIIACWRYSESTACFLFVEARPDNSADGEWEASFSVSVLHGPAKSLPPGSPRSPWPTIDHGDMFLVAGHRLGPTQPSLVSEKGNTWKLMCANTPVCSWMSVQCGRRGPRRQGEQEPRTFRYSLTSQKYWHQVYQRKTQIYFKGCFSSSASWHCTLVQTILIIF